MLEIEDRDLLGTCALLMYNGRESSNLDLRSFQRMFVDKQDEIRAALATEVEQLSDGQQTVRQVEESLFGIHLSRSYLYFAVCPNAQEEGLITELNDQMIPYAFAPYDSRLYKAVPVTAEEVQKARERAAWNEQQNQLSRDATAKVDDFMTKLMAAIQRLSEQTTDPNVRRELERCVWSGLSNFKLTDAARACARMGLDFPTFILEAIEPPPNQL